MFTYKILRCMKHFFVFFLFMCMTSSFLCIPDNSLDDLFVRFKKSKKAQIGSIALLVGACLTGAYSVWQWFQGVEEVAEPDLTYGNECEQRGMLYFNDLYTKNGANIPCEGDNYLHSIVAMMWYVYAKSKEYNQWQEFKSGMTVLEDPSWKLYSFLWNYVRRYYPNDMFEECITTRYRAYPRRSTHFNSYYLRTKKAIKEYLGIIKKEPDYVHYGIDVYVDDLLLPILGKRHILFGRLGEIGGKQMMFIKFETAGLNLHDVALHAFGLIKSKIRRRVTKLLAKLKASVAVPHENLLIDELVKQGKYLSDDPSLTDYRREQVPLKIMAKFLTFLLSKNGGIDSKKARMLRRQTKSFGIRAIIEIAKKFIRNSQGTKMWRHELKKFVDKLKALYPDWPLRFGNEIILMHEMI